MKKEIPNLLTLGNLLAGCIGLWFVMQGDLVSASYCIFISLICDFFDGFLARALQAYSELGKQLDSLADMVSFGVLPAFILFSLVEQSCGTQCTVGLFGFYKPFMVFALVLMSAYRLAKFNIDTRQSDQFIHAGHARFAIFLVDIDLYADLKWCCLIGAIFVQLFGNFNAITAMHPVGVLRHFFGFVGL
jgi:CDP-diacylglycerol--serine O-phosphatidyltransferase